MPRRRRVGGRHQPSRCTGPTAAARIDPRCRQTPPPSSLSGSLAARRPSINNTAGIRAGKQPPRLWQRVATGEAGPSPEASSSRRPRDSRPSQTERRLQYRVLCEVMRYDVASLNGQHEQWLVNDSDGRNCYALTVEYIIVAFFTSYKK